MAVVVQSLQRSTELNPTSYKAWHAWAMINFDAVQLYQDSSTSSSINGFVRSISLSDLALQDTLRLLTMWFKYGGFDSVDDAVTRGFELIPVEMWLDVTPQIIARIHTPISRVRLSVHTLLDRVARAHPGASSTRSPSRPSRSPNRARRRRRQCSRGCASRATHWSSRRRSSRPSSSAPPSYGTRCGMARSRRPASLLWRAGCRRHAGDAGACTRCSAGPETMREAAFQQAFGAEMEQATRTASATASTRTARAHAAWDIYYASSVASRSRSQLNSSTQQSRRSSSRRATSSWPCLERTRRANPSRAFTRSH